MPNKAKHERQRSCLDLHFWASPLHCGPCWPRYSANERPLSTQSGRSIRSEIAQIQGILTAAVTSRRTLHHVVEFPVGGYR